VLTFALRRWRSTQADHAHIRRLAERLYNGITAQCTRIVRNGDPNGYPGCTNLSFAAVEGESRASRHFFVSGIQVSRDRVGRSVNGGTMIEDEYPLTLPLPSLLLRPATVLMSIKDIAVSSGSACTSASLEPSYVLRALGAEEDMAHSSIRFGIGRFTTEEEVDYVVDKVVKSVQRAFAVFSVPGSVVGAHRESDVGRVVLRLCGQARVEHI
jgi:cysteine desulfurase